METQEDEVTGKSRPKIVDTGEGNTIQVGSTNTYIEHPANMSDSDLPSVEGPSDSPDHKTPTETPDVFMTGKGGVLQSGHTNLIVAIHKEDGKESSPTTVEPSVTSTHAHSSDLTVDADLESRDIPSLQGNIRDVPLNQLSELNMKQQTEPKSIDTEKPRLTHLNIPNVNDKDFMSEDFNHPSTHNSLPSEWSALKRDVGVNTESVNDVTEDGVTDPDSRIHFQQVRGRYVTQQGHINTVVDIHLDELFLEEARRGGDLTVTSSEGRLLSLVWSGMSEAVQECKTSWTLQLTQQSESVENEILKLMSHDIFGPLRKLVQDVFTKYKAGMKEILTGSLIFVFFHTNESSAQKMIDDRDQVETLFRQMLIQIGKGELEFSLKAVLLSEDTSVDVKVDVPQAPPKEDPSDESAPKIPLDMDVLVQSLQSRMQISQEDTVLEERMQSMESGLKQVQSDIAEIKQLTATFEKLAFLMGSSLSQTLSMHTEVESRHALLEKEVTSSKHVVFDDQRAERNEQPRKFERVGESAAPDEPTEATNFIPDVDPATITMALNSGDLRNTRKTEEKRSRRSTKLFHEAERLLNSLSVSSVGKSSTNKEVKRLAESVAEALVDDDPPPPRAKSIDTLLCLDVSESIGEDGLQQVKLIAHDFVDGIQEIAEKYSLEENIAVIAMGGRASVVQNLTIDYSLIKDAIDSLQLGGRSPIFETLTVCVAAIKGRGGVLSVGGEHNIRPRIIFITDGKPTNDAQESGPDTPSTDHNTKIQLIRLVGEFSPKEHSSTPNPIVWVPVGNADRNFLSSLAKIGPGSLVEGSDIRSICSYYRIQDNIGKVYICVKNKAGNYSSEETEAIVEALAEGMTAAEKKEIARAVKNKIENKEVTDPDSEPNDYNHIHETTNTELPALGSRVVRGPSWRYEDQDTGGPGTVINHAKDDGYLWVLWDLNTTVCRYRHGASGKYDVVTVEDQPRILMPDELIEVGVKVRRGPDWSHGDIDGGPDKVGVVIRKRKDGKVKVRWPNGEIKSCRYGYDGRFDLVICDDKPSETEPPRPATPQEDKDYEQTSKQRPHELWQKKDDFGQWRLYDRDHNEKLKKEFSRRPNGSCLLSIHGKNHRVLFKEMIDKDLENNIRQDVRRIVVSDEKCDELIAMELSLYGASSWTTS